MLGHLFGFGFWISMICLIVTYYKFEWTAIIYIYAVILTIRGLLLTNGGFLKGMKDNNEMSELSLVEIKIYQGTDTITDKLLGFFIGLKIGINSIVLLIIAYTVATLFHYIF